MTDKELKHLKRAELLEMLISQVEENERLKKSLEKAQKALSDRQILINQAGSIADAALQLNGVFDAAQTAAAQYLENIQRLSGEQEAICQKMESDARKRRRPSVRRPMYTARRCVQKRTHTGNRCRER